MAKINAFYIENKILYDISFMIHKLNFEIEPYFFFNSAEMNKIKVQKKHPTPEVKILKTIQCFIKCSPLVFFL